MANNQAESGESKMENIKKAVKGFIDPKEWVELS